MSAHLDNTYGATFIGMVVAAILYGVSCVQALYYFTNFQNDTWRIQLPVAAVMIFDTVHQAFISHSVYTYTVTDWGNPEQVQFIVWSILVEVIFTGITALIVQSFLTMRIWRLSRNMYLTGISAMLTTSGIVSVIVYCSKAFKIKTFLGIATNLKGESISINVLGAATDIFIAISLCTLLNFSRTGFHRSNAIINKLILFSVNTGLLTSLCALASMISILAASDTLIYVPFFFCLGRLYTNSLLATLNARKMLRGIGSQAAFTDLTPLSLIDFSNRGSIGQRQNISIKINTTTQEYPGNPQKRHEEVSQLPNAVVLPHGNEHNEEENG